MAEQVGQEKQVKNGRLEIVNDKISDKKTGSGSELQKLPTIQERPLIQDKSHYLGTIDHLFNQPISQLSDWCVRFANRKIGECN